MFYSVSVLPLIIARAANQGVPVLPEHKKIKHGIGRSEGDGGYADEDGRWGKSSRIQTADRQAKRWTSTKNMNGGPGGHWPVSTEADPMKTAVGERVLGQRPRIGKRSAGHLPTRCTEDLVDTGRFQPRQLQV